MKMRTVSDSVSWLGVADWNRRLFDALIPLPDGTSYNAYLVRGQDKTALIDSVDPEKSAILMYQLLDVDKIDYVIAQHAEQDHAGSIPLVMDKYPEARLLTTPKGKGMLPNLQVEILDPVMGRGYPGEETFAALDKLADEIAAKHAEL